jgi:uncharacterized protein YndB with AHSA1/START domain
MSTDKRLDTPGEVLDGEITRSDDGYRIEFERTLGHDVNAVFAALTEPRRLAVWEHPVEYFPELRVGATIYAHLNPQAKAFALGKVTVFEPPHSFAFRWTTNNPTLPPEFTITFVAQPDNSETVVRQVAGPFGEGYQLIGLMTSIHIHLDHLEEAVVMPVEDLPSEPWPEISAVTRDGRMRVIAQQYEQKVRAEFPELPALPLPPERRPA